MCDPKAGLVMGKPIWSRSPGAATPGVSPPLGGLSDLEGDFLWLPGASGHSWANFQ